MLLAVLDDLDVEYAAIRSHYEVVGCNIRMGDGSLLAIASIYLPSTPFIVRPADLNNCISQMIEPRMLLGDFNSYGVDWGGNMNDSRSQALRSVFDDNNMATLNTGEVTRIAPPPDRNSAIDLSVCSCQIALNCTWKVLDHPSRSDHLPILISYNNHPVPVACPSRPRPLTKHIDWQRFRCSVQGQLPASMSESPTELYNSFISIVRSSAIAAQTKPMPSTNARSNRGCQKNWWNDDMQHKYQRKKYTFQQFKRVGGRHEFLEYKKAEAQFHQARKQSKRKVWREFCTSITKDTPLATLYSMAKSYRGQAPSRPRSVLGSENWMTDFCDKLAPPMAKVEPKPFTIADIDDETNGSFDRVKPCKQH